MKGILLCGGTGSRLRPLTLVMNKNLLPVGKDPMVLYPLRKFKEAGITEICIITGSDHIGAIVDLLGSGSQYGLDLTYRVQDRPGGIAQAIGLAEAFVGEDCCTVILGDNLFDDSIADAVECYQAGGPACATVFVKEVPDPERFGVMEYDAVGLPSRIVEKPLSPPSSDAVIGVYIYPPDVFRRIRKLKPSARGELEVTDLSNSYLADGGLAVRRVDGFWVDAGTFETLKLANEWGWGLSGNL